MTNLYLEGGKKGGKEKETKEKDKLVDVVVIFDTMMLVREDFM